MSDIAGQTHNLINSERRKRKLSHVFWSREMYRYAKEQAGYCARVGKLVHSHRYAFQGGENLWGGRGNIRVSPRIIVNTWLNSKAGHREYLLSSRVTKAAVAIVKSKRGAYAAWAFSDEPPSYPDCPYYKTKTHAPIHKSKGHIPKYKRHRVRIWSLLRTSLGILGTFLIFMSPELSHVKWVTAFFTMAFGVISLPSGIFGAIVSYWKRRFGALFMLVAALIGFFVYMGGGGGWALLGVVLLLACSLSAFWHKIVD